MTDETETVEPDHIKIFNDVDHHRFVIEVEGKVAGFAVYHIRGGRHLFVHTEIDPSFEKQGLGSKLIKAALDEVAADGGTVVPLCPFVRAWIKRHPEYDSLVDHELLATIEKA
ncbi:MAG: N-acetyltransferase [Acidimicrobiia bacterium]|nr:N-acetyltransferase [Acidimicrobiia bacterium]